MSARSREPGGEEEVTRGGGRPGTRSPASFPQEGAAQPQARRPRALTPASRTRKEPRAQRPRELKPTPRPGDPGQPCRASAWGDKEWAE